MARTSTMRMHGPHQHHAHAWPAQASACSPRALSLPESTRTVPVCSCTADRISRIASVQTCVLSDPSQPLTREQYADALGRAGSVEELGEVLPQVYGIVDCAFIDNAFNVIIAEECDSLDNDSYGLAAAAFISAISLTLTTFYFCICIQCASFPLPPAPCTPHDTITLKERRTDLKRQGRACVSSLL